MHKVTSEDMDLLEKFLASSYSKGDAGVYAVCPRKDVTIVMYFFWSDDVASHKWPNFAGALLETWRNCGLLPTVIVTNMLHQCVQDFAAIYSNVDVQVEEELRPGNINSMSIDCNSKLHKRFSTKYVLIVQDDGFPLRRGLDEFVEKNYDFIGSPYCRAKKIPDLLTRILNFCPSNGGFSLRSKGICERAAFYWEKEYSCRDFVVNEMSEDLFYTKTLPTRSLSFWFYRRQAPSIIAERFSYEGVFPLYSKAMPFGFHTATGFAVLVRRFGNSILSVNS